MTAAESIRASIVDRLTPNTEPNYIERLEKLGAVLASRGWTGPECLFALALHAVSVHNVKPEGVGRAHLYRVAANNLHTIEEAALEIGLRMVKEDDSGND